MWSNLARRALVPVILAAGFVALPLIDADHDLPSRLPVPFEAICDADLAWPSSNPAGATQSAMILSFDSLADVMSSPWFEGGEGTARDPVVIEIPGCLELFVEVEAIDFHLEFRAMTYWAATSLTSTQQDDLALPASCETRDAVYCIHDLDPDGLVIIRDFQPNHGVTMVNVEDAHVRFEQPLHAAVPKGGSIGDAYLGAVIDVVGVVWYGMDDTSVSYGGEYNIVGSNLQAQASWCFDDPLDYLPPVSPGPTEPLPLPTEPHETASGVYSPILADLAPPSPSVGPVPLPISNVVTDPVLVALSTFDLPEWFGDELDDAWAENINARDALLDRYRYAPAIEAEPDAMDVVLFALDGAGDLNVLGSTLGGAFVTVFAEDAEVDSIGSAFTCSGWGIVAIDSDITSVRTKFEEVAIPYKLNGAGNLTQPTEGMVGPPAPAHPFRSICDIYESTHPATIVTDQPVTIFGPNFADGIPIHANDAIDGSQVYGGLANVVAVPDNVEVRGAIHEPTGTASGVCLGVYDLPAVAAPVEPPNELPYPCPVSDVREPSDCLPPCDNPLDPSCEFCEPFCMTSTASSFLLPLFGTAVTYPCASPTPQAPCYGLLDGAGAQRYYPSTTVPAIGIINIPLVAPDLTSVHYLLAAGIPGVPLPGFQGDASMLGFEVGFYNFQVPLTGATAGFGAMVPGTVSGGYGFKTRLPFETDDIVYHYQEQSFPFTCVGCLLDGVPSLGLGSLTTCVSGQLAEPLARLAVDLVIERAGTNCGMTDDGTAGAQHHAEYGSLQATASLENRSPRRSHVRVVQDSGAAQTHVVVGISQDVGNFGFEYQGGSPSDSLEVTAAATGMDRATYSASLKGEADIETTLDLEAGPYVDPGPMGSSHFSSDVPLDGIGEGMGPTGDDGGTPPQRSISIDSLTVLLNRLRALDRDRLESTIAPVNGPLHVVAKVGDPILVEFSLTQDAPASVMAFLEHERYLSAALTTIQINGELVPLDGEVKATASTGSVPQPFVDVRFERGFPRNIDASINVAGLAIHANSGPIEEAHVAWGGATEFRVVTPDDARAYADGSFGLVVDAARGGDTLFVDLSNVAGPLNIDGQFDQDLHARGRFMQAEPLVANVVLHAGAKPSTLPIPVDVQATVELIPDSSNQVALELDFVNQCAESEAEQWTVKLHTLSGAIGDYLLDYSGPDRLCEPPGPVVLTVQGRYLDEVELEFQDGQLAGVVQMPADSSVYLGDDGWIVVDGIVRGTKLEGRVAGIAGFKKFDVSVNGDFDVQGTILSTQEAPWEVTKLEVIPNVQDLSTFVRLQPLRIVPGAEGRNHIELKLDDSQLLLNVAEGRISDWNVEFDLPEGTAGIPLPLQGYMQGKHLAGLSVTLADQEGESGQLDVRYMSPDGSVITPDLVEIHAHVAGWIDLDINIQELFTGRLDMLASYHDGDATTAEVVSTAAKFGVQGDLTFVPSPTEEITKWTLSIERTRDSLRAAMDSGGGVIKSADLLIQKKGVTIIDADMSYLSTALVSVGNDPWNPTCIPHVRVKWMAPEDEALLPASEQSTLSATLTNFINNIDGLTVTGTGLNMLDVSVNAVGDGSFAAIDFDALNLDYDGSLTVNADFDDWAVLETCSPLIVNPIPPKLEATVEVTRNSNPFAQDYSPFDFFDDDYGEPIHNCSGVSRTHVTAIAKIPLVPDTSEDLYLLEPETGHAADPSIDLKVTTTSHAHDPNPPPPPTTC